MFRMSEYAKLDVGLPSQSIATNNVTGSYFSLADHREALAVLVVGAIAEAATATLQIMEATDDAAAGAQAISGAAAVITGGSGGDASGIAFVDLTHFALSDTYTHVACKVTTVGTVICGAVLMRGDAREAVSQTATGAAETVV